ncbi:MAG: hypothetical protein FWE98_04665 [Oscillospiraceae bacterium]|nr:hypothetical protein [Oscillospiraceae bacterium]
MKKILLALAGTLAVHALEYFLIGRKIGDRAGLPAKKSFLFCVLGGFIWWLPLKRKLEAGDGE